MKNTIYDEDNIVEIFLRGGLSFNVPFVTVQDYTDNEGINHIDDFFDSRRKDKDYKDFSYSFPEISKTTNIETGRHIYFYISDVLAWIIPRG